MAETPVIDVAAARADELEHVLLQHIVPALRADQVVAVPTDTIYGLACRAQSAVAVEQIYRIKGRDERKPVAICVAEVADIARFGHVTVPDALLHALLPGPVTVVLRRTPLLNAALNPHTPLIGIRVPDHVFTRRLVACLGEALALTSANRSGEPSTLRVDEFRALWPQLGLVVDAGALSASRAGSTVVDLSEPRPLDNLFMHIIVADLGI